jgi:hypothetical protein
VPFFLDAQDGFVDEGYSSYVQIFFREERMPIAEGWKRSETLIDVAVLHPIQKIIESESEWHPSGVQPNPWIRLGPDGPIDPITANSI